MIKKLILPTIIALTLLSPLSAHSLTHDEKNVLLDQLDSIETNLHHLKFSQEGGENATSCVGLIESMETPLVVTGMCIMEDEYDCAHHSISKILKRLNEATMLNCKNPVLISQIINEISNLNLQIRD